MASLVAFLYECIIDSIQLRIFADFWRFIVGLDVHKLHVFWYNEKRVFMRIEAERRFVY